MITLHSIAREITLKKICDLAWLWQNRICPVCTSNTCRNRHNCSGVLLNTRSTSYCECRRCANYRDIENGAIPYHFWDYETYPNVGTVCPYCNSGNCPPIGEFNI